MGLGKAFAPVTTDDLDRARRDPQFRRKLLQQNLDELLTAIKSARTHPSGNGTKLIREGVELAVRLAEIIQNDGGKPSALYGSSAPD
jgi:hypothetical protein